MVDEVRWMNYSELAQVLGKGTHAARALARRKRWPRKAGEDGLTRVGLPLEPVESKAEPKRPIRYKIEARR